MQKVILLTIAVIFNLQFAFSENPTDKSDLPEPNNLKVSGTVVDKTTGEALVGVKVKIEGTDREVYTNFDGKFEFDNLTPGEYNISYNMVTYEDLKLSNVKISSGENEHEVTVKLRPVSVAPKRNNQTAPALNFG